MINAALMIIVETLKAMLFKIAFKSVLERFITRVVLWGGDKLVLMTSNDLDNQTWADIRAELTGKRLKVADDDFKQSFEDWSE